MQNINKFKLLASILIICLAVFLTGCQVTLEQGELLEKNNRTSDATKLYWEIVKGNPATYSKETKQEAQKRILRLKDPSITHEFQKEILTNQDGSSKFLICDLILAYNSTSDYDCIIVAGVMENNIESKKYYADSLSTLNNSEITTKLIELYPELVEKYNSELLEAKKKGITANISSTQLLNYYKFLALYDLPETKEFLINLIQTKKAEDLPSLIIASLLINDPIIVEPLLSIAKNVSLFDQKILTNIFIKFNEPKTYSYLIEQAVISTENEAKIIKHLENNLTTANLQHIAKTFADNSYKVELLSVQMAKNLIKQVPSKEAVSHLVKLLQLNNIQKNQVSYAEIQDITLFINQNMTKENLYDLLSALERNLAIKPTNDFYALEELFQQNLSLINKYYSSNEYLRSFMLELKSLASVYKARENFNSAVQKARASEEIETVKLLLEDIVSLTGIITSNQPASKLLTNVKFYANRVEDANIKKALTSIIKSSQYEKTISTDDSLNTVIMPEALKQTPTSTIYLHDEEAHE